MKLLTLKTILTWQMLVFLRRLRKQLGRLSSMTTTNRSNCSKLYLGLLFQSRNTEDLKHANCKQTSNLLPIINYSEIRFRIYNTAFAG
jgi:hypothetical protein